MVDAGATRDAVDLPAVRSHDASMEGRVGLGIAATGATLHVVSPIEYLFYH
jgi:hypothetical protein